MRVMTPPARSQEFLPVMSAGNEGTTPGGSAVSGTANTVTSPATAKNCLCVGASQGSSSGAAGWGVPPAPAGPFQVYGMAVARQGSGVNVTATLLKVGRGLSGVLALLLANTTQGCNREQ